MRGRAIVLALAVVLATAACGGEETQPTASATPMPAVTPGPTPAPTPSHEAGSPDTEQLAYVGPDGALWLVNDDGGNLRKITDQCGGRLSWSPAGDLLACSYFSIVVFDMSGRQVWRANDAAAAFGPHWSPDGLRIAYRAQDASLHVANIDGGANSAVAEDAMPLAWMGADTLLAGLNVIEEEFAHQYDAYLIDSSGVLVSRMPYFDDGRRLWMMPGGNLAVVVDGALSAGGIGVFDFASDRVWPLEGLFAGGVSEAIPDHYVSFSADGDSVYAMNREANATIIRRATTDGTSVTEVGTVSGLLLAVSGAGRVAWLEPGGVPAKFTITDLERGTNVEVGLGYGDMAWRPEPPAAVSP